jgi:uncharacterized membrane protein
MQERPVDPPAPPPSVPPTPALRRARWLALGSCAALVLLGLAWELLLAPTGRGTLAIKVLPLVAALPGLWRWRLYTSRWVSLAVWLYVTEGLVRAWSDVGPGQALALLEVLLAVLLFGACAVQVRWRLRAGRQAALASPAPAPASVPPPADASPTGTLPAGTTPARAAPQGGA